MRLPMFVAVIVISVMPLWSLAEDISTPSGWIGLGFTIQKSSDPGGSSWLHVQQVAPDGPAYLAGIRPQDGITAIDGRPVAFANKKEAVSFFASRLTPGRTFKFLIVRRDQKLNVRVKVAPLPLDYQRRWNDNREQLKRPNQR